MSGARFSAALPPLKSRITSSANPDQRTAETLSVQPRPGGALASALLGWVCHPVRLLSATSTFTMNEDRLGVTGGRSHLSFCCRKGRVWSDFGVQVLKILRDGDRLHRSFLLLWL